MSAPPIAAGTCDAAGRRRGGVRLTGLGAVVLCGLLGGAPSARADDVVWRPTNAQAHVARVVLATNALAHPGAGRRVMRVATMTRWTGAPTRLLVLDGARDPRGRLWLKVRLPVRPNTAAGWVNADHVRTTVTPWRLVVRTARRQVRVYRSGRLVRAFGAVVGSSATPTPRGLFAIYERDRQPNPAGFLGPWALHVTAHSNVLDNYGGGPGRVAIHGRAGASLLDPLGSARSHGCVRIDNRHVSWLARRLVAGTPVRIIR
jgi:lipoprotein-anchoring transpeptidase ErfK/SrfK